MVRWKHIKNDIKKKASSELSSQLEWTSQAYDLQHEIVMTPKIAKRKKNTSILFFEKIIKVNSSQSFRSMI